MKTLKSLLLGSSVALVAATSAQAADLIAEPAADYVKVCDAFGTGFYYIPGTETCLRISGEMRFFVFFDDQGGANNDDFRYEFDSRFRVRFDARSQTELGTLRGFTEFELEFDNSSATNNLITSRHAFIQLGGFIAGHTTSFFSLVGSPYLDGGIISSKGYRHNYLGYTYAAGNGFTASIALEDPDPTATGVANRDDNAPSLVGALRVKQSWGEVGVSAAVVDNETLDTGFALSAAARINVGSNGNFRIAALYSEDASYYTTGSGEVFAAYAVYQHKFSSKLSGALGVDYADVDTAAGTDYTEYEITANLVYAPVSGMDVGLELYYTDRDNAGVVADTDAFGGFLRLRRTF